MSSSQDIEPTMEDFFTIMSAMMANDPKFKLGVEMILSGKDSSDVITSIHVEDDLSVLVGSKEFIDGNVEDLNIKEKCVQILELMDKEFTEEKDTIADLASNDNLEESLLNIKIKDNLVQVPESLLSDDVESV
uniref:Uncharacterized protein n=1 Tax=viral metagenome TaxID=1070528 RepID=A0A6C0BDI2_9ZZZZ